MDWSSVGTLLEAKDRVDNILSVLRFLIFGEKSQRCLSSFPGTYPIPIVGRDLQNLKTSEYWVTEQPVEENYCMLLSLEDGVYLINGEMCVFSVDMKLPCDDLENNQHMTLLDGVMVFSHNYQKMCFMVVDVVSSSGKKCGGTLSQRFLDIRDIIQPLRRKYPPGDEASLPFLVLGQDYVKFKQLKSFLGKIERFEDEQGARYIYHNRTRYHDTSSLIFVPDNIVWCPWENRQIKSWMWPDLDLIKFLVRFEEVGDVNPAIVAFVTGPNDDLLRYRPLELSPNHVEILSEFLHATPEGVTASFAFDAESGIWNFCRISDGSPVYLLTLTAYLERVASNVTRLQLESLSTGTHSSPQSSLHGSTSTLTPNSNTPSSTTPTGSTPSNTYTPNPATPYTPSPRQNSSNYGHSPEEVYDTPPELSRSSAVPRGSRQTQHSYINSSRLQQTNNSRKRGPEGSLEGLGKKYKQ
eukprot:TRINITY_DN3274_c0_g1_i1.p1 TRINITY_DN3274_c0_g1~~TRINITY_DN3274_c0_g1_i1.p1  ORF type:complete len:512 (-),score=62.28 TRINITY_DN3274_c0_g1_i1:89-1489(-)